LTTKTIEDTRYGLIFDQICVEAYLQKAKEANRRAEAINADAVAAYNEEMLRLRAALAERDEFRFRAARLLNGSAEEDDA
jgi:hypothetical protein